MGSSTKHTALVAGLLAAWLAGELSVSRPVLAQAEPEAPARQTAPPRVEQQNQPAPSDTDPATKDPATKDPATKEPADKAPAAKEPGDVPVEQPSPRAKSGEPKPEITIRPAGSSQDLLHSFGVDPSHYDMLVDGQEIDEAEAEARLKFMYAVRRFKTLQIHKWINTKPDLADFAAHPGKHRGEIVKLTGRVTQISMERPLPEQVVRFEFTHFYRCNFQLTAPPTETSPAKTPEKKAEPAEDAEPKQDADAADDAAEPKPVVADAKPAGRQALIFSPIIPKAWLAPDAVMPDGGWRASIEGFFLKIGAEGRLVFVAQRVAWHPQGLLGDLGMDMGLFDEVSPGPLGTSDREAFYQMLDAMGRVGTQELTRRTQLKLGATTFGSTHVRAWPELIRSLSAQESALEASGAQEIYKRLPEDLRKKLAGVPRGATPPEALQAECYAAFNQLLADPELFDARAWQQDRMSQEADGRLHKALARLSKAELQTLNCRLLETAFAAELAPGTGGQLTPEQLKDPSGFVHRIRVEARHSTPRPGKRLFAGFSESLQAAIRDLPEGAAPGEPLEKRVLAAVNQVVKNPNLYDTIAWNAYPLPQEIADQLDKLVAGFSAEDLQRYNRLLFEAAFPEMLAQSHPYSVVPLFTQPERQLGRLVSLSGTCRRALRVPVDDPDIRTRYQIDHYFEMQIFTEDSQSNPVTFCVRSLPPGMPEGERISIKVRVAGFFFKTWAYNIPLTEERKKEILKRLPADKRAKFKAEDERMHTPLLIARQPVWLKDPPLTPSPTAGYVAGTLFVGAILVAWVALWVTNRGDRRFKEAALTKQYELEPGENLNKAGIEESPEVHFRNYDPATASAAQAEAEAAADPSQPAPQSRVGRRYYIKRGSPAMLIGGAFSRKLFGAESGDPADAPRRKGDNIFQGVVGDEKSRQSAIRSVAVFVVPMFLVIGLYMILRVFSQAAPGSGGAPVIRSNPPANTAPQN